MRLVCFLFVALTGMAFAQDTSFPSGPQYLIPSNSSPLFLQPIATPSISLGETSQGTSTATEAFLTQEAGASAPVTLADIYWGNGAAVEADNPRLVTPSMSLPRPTPSEAAFETATEQAAAPAEGTISTAEQASVIEITSSEVPRNLPASIFNPGVTGTADTQSLLNRGYGMSLGELAAYWKSHKRPASHVITNEDLERKPR